MTVVTLVLVMLSGCSGRDGAPSGEEGETTDSGPMVHYSDPADCAAGTAPGSVEGLIRWPYVQWVTDEAATIAWGAPTEGAAGAVTVSRGDFSAAPEVAVQTIPYSDDGAEMRLYSGRVTGLEPGTEYCYAVSVDGVELAGGLRFRTAPASPQAPIKMFVIGDFGSGSAEQVRLAEVMAAHSDDVNIWLTTGDNAYGSGTYGEFHDKVFAVYQELMTRIPVYPTPGNHDYKTDDAQPYLDNFFLPEDAWREDHRERYYTLDFGPMTYFAFDSEAPLQQVLGSDEQSEPRWAAAVLAEESRPWRVAAFHKPYYSGHPDRGPDFAVGIHLMPLIDEHGIDLGLTGHNHFYERFAPLRAGEPDPDGVTWIVTGGGGQSLYEIGAEDHQEVVRQEHHFMLIEIDGCALRGQAISVDDEVIDAFTIDRCG